MAREIEEQHPIPQDISSYQFRLVGDMTLKQFLQVAAGALIALFLYASPLPVYVKWPLILISVLLGVALAFMPIDDRPLGTWIIAFFRSIYNPTIFVWKLAVKQPSYFQAEARVAPTATPTTAPVKNTVAPAVQKPKPQLPGPTTPTPITERAEGTIYLSQSESKAMTNLESSEQSFLSKVTHLFSVPTPSLSTPTQKRVKITPAAAEAEKISQTLNVTLPVDETAKTPPPPPVVNQPGSMTTTVNPVLQKGQQISGVASAQFAQTGSGPEPPTNPNLIVGQVIEPDGSMIEGAILEIKDEQGRPVRALKTNKLGHFMIVTPLMDGNYEITSEKEGYEFDPVVFNAQGKIIPPLIIKSKNQPEAAPENTSVN